MFYRKQKFVVEEIYIILNCLTITIRFRIKGTCLFLILSYIFFSNNLVLQVIHGVIK